jgi:hypothetical protein
MPISVKSSQAVGTAVFKVFDLQVARTGFTAISVQMVLGKKSGRLVGAQLVVLEGAAYRVNEAAVLIHQKMTVQAFSQFHLAYARALWIGTPTRYFLSSLLGQKNRLTPPRFKHSVTGNTGGSGMTLIKTHNIDGIHNTTGLKRHQSSEMIKSLLDTIKKTLASG